MKVADVMTTTLVTVGPDTSWKQVAEQMLDANVSGLPVVDEDGYLLGLVTEADLVSKPAFGEHRRRSLEAFIDLLSGDARWAHKADGATAADLMTPAVITAAPEEDVRVAARRMLDRRVKRLPVVEGGRLVGIVSRRDLLWVFHRADGDIADELKEKLASPLHAPDNHEVTFTVEDGVVTLEGSVAMDWDVPVVEGLTRRVPGVVHVVNQLTFRETTPR